MKKVAGAFVVALIIFSQADAALGGGEFTLVPREPVGEIKVRYLSDKNPTGEELTAIPMQSCDRFLGKVEAGKVQLLAFKIPGSNSYYIQPELPPGGFYVFTGKRLVGFILTPGNLQYCFAFARIDGVPDAKTAFARFIADPPDSVVKSKDGRDFWMLGLNGGLPLRVWSDGIGGGAGVPQVTSLSFRNGVLKIEADSVGLPTVVVTFRIDIEKGALLQSLVDGVDVTGAGWTGVW